MSPTYSQPGHAPLAGYSLEYSQSASPHALNSITPQCASPLRVPSSTRYRPLPLTTPPMYARTQHQGRIDAAAAAPLMLRPPACPPCSVMAPSAAGAPALAAAALRQDYLDHVRAGGVGVAVRWTMEGDEAYGGHHCTDIVPNTFVQVGWAWQMPVWTMEGEAYCHCSDNCTYCTACTADGLWGHCDQGVGPGQVSSEDRPSEPPDLLVSVHPHPIPKRSPKP